MMRRLDWYVWVVGVVWLVGLSAYSVHLFSARPPLNQVGNFAGFIDLRWSELATAILVGFMMLVVEVEATQSGLDPFWVRRRFLAVVLGAIVVGRLEIVLFPPSQLELYGMSGPAAFWANPILIFDFSRGGLALSGAIIGGLSAWYGALRIAGEPLQRWTRPTILGLAAGLSVGWWIRFLAQDLYGYPFRWGMWLPEIARPLQFTATARFQPLFLWEGLIALVSFVAVYWMSKRESTIPIWWVFALGYSLRIVSWPLRWNISAPSWFGTAEGVLHLGILFVCLWFIPRLNNS